MSRYMLLLYAPATDSAGERERWADMPLWQELTEGLREAGLLVDNSPLHSVETATTVRPPSASICSATAFALSAAVAYVSATTAPSAASRLAIAAPIPRLPPVTSATCRKDRSFVPSCLSGA